MISLFFVTQVLAQCEQDSLQSPIDIVQPFIYFNPQISWYLKPQHQAVLYNDGYHLRIDGDFGGFTWQNSYFWSSELLFKSPAEHTLQGERLTMELQVFFRDQYDNQAVIAALFDLNDQPSSFLSQLGFNSIQLRASDEGFLWPLRYPVDLVSLFGKQKEFIFYQGSTTVEPCVTNVTWFILTSTYRISEIQAANFPNSIYGNYRGVQDLQGREIYTTVESIADSSTTDEDEESSDDQNVDFGQTYNDVQDNFIVENESYENETPDVDSIYTFN